MELLIEDHKVKTSVFLNLILLTATCVSYS